MNVKEEIIRILDYLCDFETGEEVFTAYTLRDDLRLTEEELNSVRQDINDTFSLGLSPEDLDPLETIDDLIDLVTKKKTF